MEREFRLPYGKGHEVLTLGAEHLAGVLASGIQGYGPSADGETLVRDAMAKSAAEAMELAKGLVGKDDYKVTVIPDGVSVIVRGMF